MDKMKIFIYWPNRVQTLDPEFMYTAKGKQYYQWARDQEEAHRYENELLRRMIERKIFKNNTDY